MSAQEQLPCTPRLRFRRYRESDVSALADVFGDPYARQFYPEHQQHEQLVAWIAWNLRNYEEYGFGLWALELHDTGEFVGDAGLTFQPVEGASLLEIGYHVHPSRRRQGLATEAAAACLKWAFEQTLENSVCSIVHPENLASIGVAQRVHRWQRVVAGIRGPRLLFYTPRETWSIEK
jgi:RimJ/RimL family protein N-acetyltransferase